MVSALAAALHLICDQGGLGQLRLPYASCLLFLDVLVLLLLLLLVVVVVVVVVVVIVPVLDFQRWHWAPCKVQPKMIQSAGGVQVLLQMGGEVLEIG